MALFDFLKPKKDPPPSGPSPHYAFAHYALRHIALADPMRFLAIAASTESSEFLEAILKDVEEQCGCKALFSASAIKVHPTRVKNFPCAIIEMPEPKEAAEAFMVAVVALIDLSQKASPDFKAVGGRFFTLEKGIAFANAPRTVLAEWDSSSHSNYGKGPDATVDAFVQAICEHV